MSDRAPDAPAIDLHRVLLEIEEEVRAKRASGELPQDLERELDLVFARYAPPGAVEGDFDALLERAEQQSFIDLLAPNESSRPGVPHVKRVVQKAVRWYMRYVVEQFAGFAHTMSKAVRLLGDRVTELEQLRAPESEVQAAFHDAVDPSKPWSGRIVAAMTGAHGRVLHARCGSGSLVSDLRAAGIDAYGVDSASDYVAVGTATGLDLRPDDEREHLRRLAAGSLGGLVLTGGPDILPRGAQIELMDLAATVLAKDGVLNITGSNPQSWERTHTPVEVDLAPGRPMHAETWVRLLADRGFRDVEVTQGPRLGGLDPVPGTDETVAGVNANLHRLNELLFPPATFLITARR